MRLVPRDIVNCVFADAVFQAVHQRRNTVIEAGLVNAGTRQ